MSILLASKTINHCWSLCESLAYIDSGGGGGGGAAAIGPNASLYMESSKINCISIIYSVYVFFFSFLFFSFIFFSFFFSYLELLKLVAKHIRALEFIFLVFSHKSYLHCFAKQTGPVKPGTGKATSPVW